MSASNKAFKSSNSLEDELEATQKEYRNFIYSISHDLGTPIRTVVNFSRLLEEKYANSLDEKGRRYLEFIVQGGEKAQAMLSGLVQHSRVTTHGKALEKTNPLRPLNRALKHLLPEIRKAEANIDVPDSMPNVMADEQQVEQLWFVLIENAIVYRDEPTIPQISINAERKGNMCAFSVSDNGIGVAEEHCEKVFDVFRRLHPDNEFSGIGIGLSIAKAIVERHGGSIKLEPVTPTGCIATFTLKAAN